MGRPKALLPRSDGRSFITAVIDTAFAGGVDGVVIVIGPPHGRLIAQAIDEEVRAQPSGSPRRPAVVLARNAHPERGMLSSVQTGIAALSPDTSAALIWPVDVPYVQPTTVRCLCERGADRIVVPVHNGRGGHPLLVSRPWFSAVQKLAAARGLRAVLEDHRSAVLRWAVDDEGVLHDIDTPEDYRTRPATSPPPAEDERKEEGHSRA
jgi:CTP:molybdopterin cytidylyltransferase MocA